jgi:hypothetical protein
MPVTLVGFSPSECFPPAEAVTPLDVRNPPGVDAALARRAGTSGMCLGIRVCRGQCLVVCSSDRGAALAFRAWRLAGVRLPARVVRRARDPILSWGSCLFRACRENGSGVQSPGALLPWAFPSRPRPPHMPLEVAWWGVVEDVGPPESHSARSRTHRLSPVCRPS